MWCKSTRGRTLREGGKAKVIKKLGGEKEKKMNTIKKIAIALAVLMVFSLAAPAAATYAGDHPLVTYEKGPLKDGGIVFVAVENGSAYTKLNATENSVPGDIKKTLTQDITIPACTPTITSNCIPAGKTVKMARLYNYVSWSTSDNDTTMTSGVPAEAEMTFSDGTNTWTKACVHGYTDAQIADVPNPISYGTDAVQYWDTKGPNYLCGSKYDFPSGTFAWDVTNMVTGSGTYVATITNADSTPTGFRPGKEYPSGYRERFVTYGFGLLVVYENTSFSNPVDGKYWIDEGCDLLYNTSKYSVYEPVATTYAPFKEGVGGINNTTTAGLTQVVVSSNKGNELDWPNSENMIYFNGLTTAEEIGPSTAVSFKAIGVNYDEMKSLSLLKPSRNFVYFQDRDINGDGKGDNEVVSNAFLMVEWA
jgi:hypothetical protein